MGKGDDRHAVELELLADAPRELAQPEQVSDGEPADRDDQAGSEQRELPRAPERAEFLLVRRGQAVTAASWRSSRIAAGDRGAVEGRVEGGEVRGLYVDFSTYLCTY